MSNPSVNKRQKERGRQERAKEKLVKKADRAREKPARVAVNGEDPDLVGIVAGPQPKAEEDE